jgi:hypothetical protein
VPPITNSDLHGLLPNPRPSTPINVGRLELLLSDHPDRELVDYVLSNLRLGADIGFRGPWHPRFTPNTKSALDNPEQVDQAIQKEIELGNTAGPFTHPPLPNFVCSALSIRPKKTKGFRLILDLS